MSFITLLEAENSECRNIGTLEVNGNLESSFKDAVEAHFDADLIKYEFQREDVTNLKDCLSAYPIDVKVILNDKGTDETVERIVELSETWLYQ